MRLGARNFSTFNPVSDIDSFISLGQVISLGYIRITTSIKWRCSEVSWRFIRLCLQHTLKKSNLIHLLMNGILKYEWKHFLVSEAQEFHSEGVSRRRVTTASVSRYDFTLTALTHPRKITWNLTLWQHHARQIPGQKCVLIAEYLIVAEKWKKAVFTVKKSPGVV